jgi:hypothetical protein
LYFKNLRFLDMEAPSHGLKIKAPRELKGRRARQMYRELLPLVASDGPLRGDVAALLAAYASSLADIAATPNKDRSADIDRARKLGRLLGLTS